MLRLRLTQEREREEKSKLGPWLAAWLPGCLFMRPHGRIRGEEQSYAHWETEGELEGDGKDRAELREATAMAEDEEGLDEVCIGRLCFLQPHPHYVPPPDYPRIPRREYRWKVGMKLKSSPGVQCKISHAVCLPNILGLGPEGRWRWQWIPVSLMSSAVMHIWPHHQNSSEDTLSGGISMPKSFGVGVGVVPRARLKVLTPIFGKLAVQPMVDLLPTPKLTMKRQFCFGTTKLSVQANVEINNIVGFMKWPGLSLQVDWQPANVVKLMLQPAKDVLAIQYERSFKLYPGCKGVASALAEVLAKAVPDGNSGQPGSLPLRARLDSFKVSHVITDKAARSGLLPTSAYLRASQKIGTSNHISVIPGHWIDPSFELGAPGEREFNMDVANMLEKQLTGNGWKVLRPDRDCPNLSWEEYLNWVTRQTSQGIPVLEIHGQGSKADYRGFVLGVIGDANVPLNKELAKDFGFFKMDWRGFAVPKRGGVILESFNSDEVMQMAPWHRKWSVRRLANRIVTCIERASRDNRASQGVIIDSGRKDELLALDNVFLE